MFRSLPIAGVLIMAGLSSTLTAYLMPKPEESDDL